MSLYCICSFPSFKAIVTNNNKPLTNNNKKGIFNFYIKGKQFHFQAF